MPIDYRCILSVWIHPLAKQLPTYPNLSRNQWRTFVFHLYPEHVQFNAVENVHNAKLCKPCVDYMKTKTSTPPKTLNENNNQKLRAEL